MTQAPLIEIDVSKAFFVTRCVGAAAVNSVYANELRDVRLRAGETPVAIGGKPSEGARQGYFETSLTDGTTGYYMRRADDCLQAAIASCAQIPPHLVPDFQLDDQLAAGVDPEYLTRKVWRRLGEWSDQCGLRVMIHPVAPKSAKRWIGFIDNGGNFNDHSLLMSGRACLFDPQTPPGAKQEYSPLSSDCDWGITID